MYTLCLSVSLFPLCIPSVSLSLCLSLLLNQATSELNYDCFLTSTQISFTLFIFIFFFHIHIHFFLLYFICFDEHSNQLHSIHSPPPTHSHKYTHTHTHPTSIATHHTILSHCTLMASPLVPPPHLPVPSLLGTSHIPMFPGAFETLLREARRQRLELRTIWGGIAWQKLFGV